MKIIIEDGLNLFKKTGQGQYSQNIYKILNQLGYEVQMKRKPFLEKIKNSIIKRILYFLWLNIIFPFTVIFNKSNIIIFTNTMTPLFKIPNKKYYPVLHDLWAYKSPDTVTSSQKLYTKFVLFSIKHNYEKIITVSNTIKNEIVDFFKCNDDDVQIIYNYFSFGEKPTVNLNETEQYEILNKIGVKSKEYILSVSTLNKRKNIPMLINAFSKINTEKKLVLVGSANSQKFCKTAPNVIFTGYISDEELMVLYKNAFIYVFPSVYEGFGIPIIDAQSFGIPVICSDIPIFREIGNDSVLYFNLKEEDDLTEKINLLLNNDTFREHFIKNHLDNISRFSLQVLSNQITNILEH